MQPIETALAPSGALHALTSHKQFIHWDTRNGVKLPINPYNGAVCDAHDPAVWMTAEDALAAGDQIAFVFTESDPFFFLDIDKACEGGQWSELATSLCGRFPTSAVEVSQSGTGLHIIGTATQYPHSKKNTTHGLELYTEKRFIALTGLHARGEAGVDVTAAYTSLVSEYFQPQAAGGLVALTDTPVAEWSGPDDDETLLQRALGSRSASAVFGGGPARATFRDLWECNTEALHDAYPDNMGDQGREYDGSSVDAALASHLAFWTGRHGTRMVRMMRASGLVRDKWDKHPSYLERTVLSACNREGDVYQGRTETPAGAALAAQDGAPSEVRQVLRTQASLVAGGRYMAPTQQMSHFEGCVYVASENKVMVPDGTLHDQGSFRGLYGGYVFSLDAINDKTTKSAWEAFTESQAIDHPKVTATVFKPNLDPGAIVKDGPWFYVNRYVPAEVESTLGNAQPFTDHITKILPDERDRLIFLSYMAACVQYKGEKFQWCPLIQGAPGNGKTLLTVCVMNAIGKRYSHMPQANDLGNIFNEWLVGNIFIGIEDVYVAEHKGEIIETIKPYITSKYGIGIQGKGSNQRTEEICCNFILNSNHKDGIRKAKDDRRFAIFYCPHQSHADIIRDGMGGDYFPRLYDWIDNRGGAAIVTNLLENMVIPDEFNPAKDCHRAPTTSSTAEAVAQGLGTVENEILECVAEGRQGFQGGWISSLQLKRMLDEKRLGTRVPLKKRCEMLASIGYVKHPALKDGRANNLVAIDGGKPRLYVHQDSQAARIYNAGDAEAAYIDAQLEPARVFAR